MKKLFGLIYFMPRSPWRRRLSLWLQGFCYVADGLTMLLSFGFVGASFTLTWARRRMRNEINRDIKRLRS